MIVFFHQCQQGFISIIETEFGWFDHGLLIMEEYQQKIRGSLLRFFEISIALG